MNLDGNTHAINRHLESRERPECCECGETSRDQLLYDGAFILCGECMEADEENGVDVSGYRRLEDWEDEE